jgi:hypothetical protein
VTAVEGQQVGIPPAHDPVRLLQTLPKKTRSYQVRDKAELDRIDTKEHRHTSENLVTCNGHSQEAHDEQKKRNEDD